MTQSKQSRKSFALCVSCVIAETPGRKTFPLRTAFRHVLRAHKKKRPKPPFLTEDYFEENPVLYFFRRQSTVNRIPSEPMITQAGHTMIFPANVSVTCGSSPVMIVITSEVAILTYSPGVPKATTASADAAKTAKKIRNQPVTLPINMGIPSRWTSLFFLNRIKGIGLNFRKNSNNKRSFL